MKANYFEWQNAYGILDWLIYLEKVSKRPETGVLVKDCYELFIKKYQNNPN